MDTQQRKEHLRKMLAEDPGDPELGYMLGMEYAGAGDDQAAVTCFRELLAMSPDYAPAYHQAGRALHRLCRAGEARAILQRGIPVAQQRGDLHAAGEMQELLANLE